MRVLALLERGLEASDSQAALVFEGGNMLDAFYPADSRRLTKALRGAPRSALAKEVAERLRSGAWQLLEGEEARRRGCVVTPAFVIPKSTPGKFRTIWDLRVINAYLERKPFRLDDLAAVARGVGRDWYFASLDLRDAYFHVGIAPADQHLICFAYKGNMIMSAVLPFGISWAPWLFTKLFRVVIRRWRSGGMVVSAYLDDIFVAAPSRELLLSQMAEMRQDLRALGFEVNEEKSRETWRPRQVGTFLGLEIDTQRGQFRVPRERLERLDKELRALVEQSRQGAVTARTVASVLGGAVCWWRALTAVRLYTRSTYDLLAQAAGDFSTCVEFSAEAREDLLTLADALRRWNGRTMWRAAAAAAVGSDASADGWGGWVRLPRQRDVCRFSGALPEQLRAQGSTVRETYAALMVLRAALERALLPPGMRVLLHSDNCGLVANVARQGGARGTVRHWTRQLLEAALAADLDLVAVWLPRDQNVLADALSRRADEDRGAWRCPAALLAAAKARWPTWLPAGTVDLFADEENRLFPRYLSRFGDPLGEHPDAFTADWGAPRRYGCAHRWRCWTARCSSWWHRAPGASRSCRTGRRRRGGLPF